MADSTGQPSAIGRTIHGVLGVWHGLSAVQNTCAILAETGIAPGLRLFASTNMEIVGKLTRALHPPKRAIVTLVAGAATIEGIAGAAYLRKSIAGGTSNIGFGLSMLLFGSFFLIDDLFDDYDLGARHRAIFTLIAVSYAAVRAANR